MPRYAWDDGLADDIRARSCDGAVVSLAAAPPLANANSEAFDAYQRSPDEAKPAAPCRSLLLSDSERPWLLADPPPTPLLPSSMLAPTTPPPPTPLLQNSPLYSDTTPLASPDCESRSPLPLGSPAPPASPCPVWRDIPVTSRGGGAGSGGESASGVVASTAGLVLELSHGAKNLVAELEQKDSEVRVLRQALADLARETGSFKPSVRSHLGMHHGEELDAQQQAQLQHIKRNLRDRQLRQRGRRSTGTIPTGCDCEARVSELRSDLEEAQAKLSEAAAREKKLCEELEQLRRVSVHSHSRRRSAELDLERCKMGVEDDLSRRFQQVSAASASAGNAILRSWSKGSNGSRRGILSTSPRTPPMPSRLSTCSSIGTAASPSSGARTPSRDALLQAENLVVKMFDLQGSRSPGAGSRSPPSSRRNTFSRSPHSSSRTCATQTQPPPTPTEESSPTRRASKEADGDGDVGTPPTLPKAHSAPSTHAPPALPKPTLRAINGCMPRFPSAELGSPKTAPRGGERQQGATRRRSCPDLTESQPRKGSFAAASSSDVPQPARTSDDSSRNVCNVPNAAMPHSLAATPATLAAPAAHAALTLTRSPGGQTLDIREVGERLQSQGSCVRSSSDFQLDGIEHVFGARLRRREEEAPAAPVSDDPIVKIARTVAARMSGCPETPRTPLAESPEPSPPPVSIGRKPLPARFTPVEVPATRLGGRFGGTASSASASSPGRAVARKEICRSMSSPMTCTVKRS